MLKNVIIVGLLAILLCGAGLPVYPKWINFAKDRTILNRQEIVAVFETEHKFGNDYKERTEAKPKKCVQIILKGSESIFMTDSSYEEISAEVLKDRN